MRFLRKIKGKTRQGRIRNSTIKEITRRIFEARTFKKRKKGRPRRTCTEQIKATGEKRGGSWEEVKKKSQDWKKWKKM
jgi:hypothetical protein